MKNVIEQAVQILNDGGVIAYPTEHCFGLGCDPHNPDAINRILTIKNRSAEQGLILLAADLDQVSVYADVYNASMKDEILVSWPGASTWCLPATSNVSRLLRGQHKTIAIRVTAHSLSKQLCVKFGGAIVSTSANRHGKPALTSAEEVRQEMHDEVDFVVDAMVGGACQASQIRDGMTGERLR